MTRPLVLFGPSGTGKSTLLKKLLAEYPDRFGFSVSHTTRAPRPGETPGVSYHYVTHAQFEQLVSQGAFLEHAQFGGNRYGTTAQAVAEVSRAPLPSTSGAGAGAGAATTTTTTAVAAAAAAGRRRAVLDIDAQGVRTIMAQHASLDPVYVFLAPPTFSALRQRLAGRGSETADSITKRLAMAAHEMRFAREKKHDVTVVNDDVDRAYALFRQVATGHVLRGGDDVPAAEPQAEQECLDALAQLEKTSEA